MKIKLVVGEIKALKKFTAVPSKNGFRRFLWQIEMRLNEGSGEIELDDTDLARIYRLANAGYRKQLLGLFGRTLGAKLCGLDRS